jgi:hypothetical protein
MESGMWSIASSRTGGGHLIIAHHILPPWRTAIAYGKCGPIKQILIKKQGVTVQN